MLVIIILSSDGCRTARTVRSTSMHRASVFSRRVPDGARSAVATAAVPALAESLGLRNEFAAGDGPPAEAIAYLRRIGAAPADIADDGLLHADAVVHVASATAAPVAEFCAGVARLVGPGVKPLVLGGVVRPMIYTGNAMYNFAYAHRVLQEPGTVMPNAFLVPMSKTADWWRRTGWSAIRTSCRATTREAGW